MTRRSTTSDRRELPFHKQLILGVALAVAGATGTGLSIFLDDGPGCEQAMAIVNDDRLNDALGDRTRRIVADVAARKTIRCLERE